MKDMTPKILSPTMSKIVVQTKLFNIDITNSLGEGKLWIQTYQAMLKKLTLHPARVVGREK